MIAPKDIHDLARDLDRQAVECLRRRSAVDLELGETLLALFNGPWLLRLGYAKQSDYGREALGLPPRTLRQFTRLARGLRKKPILREAVKRGLVPMRKALTVMNVAREEDEVIWTRAAMRLTERELGEKLRENGGSPPVEPFEFESVVLRMSAKQQDRLDSAVRMAAVALGSVVPRWMALEAIAMEWASGHGPWWPDEGEGRLCVVPVPVAAPGREASPPRLVHINDLDRRARALAAERLSFDLEFGPILRKLKRHRVWRDLGYETFDRYVRERLGVSPRTVRQRLWLTRRMDDLPELRAALRDGVLTYTKALFVAKDATPEDVTERIALAASTTLQQTERESDAKEQRQNRAAGLTRLWGPKDALETVSMGMVSCQRMFREGGEFISAGEALARMADHFLEVFREEVEREEKKSSKKRREVMARNGGYCAFPGCTRAAEHDHHVRFRSRGGSNDVTNRIPLCAAHHLRAIHRGWSSVSGRAGERLAWELGSGELGSGELGSGELGSGELGSGERFVTVGEDDVVRIV